MFRRPIVLLTYKTFYTDWRLETDTKSLFIMHNGVEVAFFPDIHSDIAQIFICLFYHGGFHVPSHELYTFIYQKRDYPEERSKAAKINKAIQRQVNLLKKKFSNLPFYIDSSHGGRLEIKNANIRPRRAPMVISRENPPIVSS